MDESPGRSRRVVDAVIAVAILVLAWFSSGAPRQTDPVYVYTERDATFVVLLLLATLPYAWRRRWPATAFLLGLGATSTLWLLGYNAGALPALLLLGSYFVALSRPAWVVVGCTAVAYGCFVLLWMADGAPYSTNQALASFVALGTSVALGWASRMRVDLAEARARAAEETARRATAEERLRIARELHDIIGHSLGTIAVQAGVSRHLLSTEPDRAAEALETIARLSRGSLDEVRATVATLRDGDASYRPLPGVADLPELVENAKGAGVSVELTVTAEADALSTQAGAAVYRITREALTNVVRHAQATAAAVHVHHRDGAVEVTVVDNGRGMPAGRAGSGNGIVGMRERAEALGGQLQTGPAPGGGFQVTARVPVATVRAP